MPSTVCPRRASASAASPAPHPTSSSAPGPGSRALIQPTRSGFIACSGAIGPAGSHHRPASASNRAISSGAAAPPV